MELSASRKAFVVFVLFMVVVFNRIDQQIFTLLLEPIRKEFSLNDTQMGLLTGIYFMSFFSLASIPIARLADITSRKAIIASSLTIWCIATAICGASRGYFQLALARFFVAVGEGGSSPANHSLLSDLYPASVRGRVFGVIASGSAIGAAIAFFLGGTLYEALGWRGVLIVVGLSGLVVVPLVVFWVPEPPRQAKEQFSTRQALAVLWSSPGFRSLTLVAAGGGFTGFAFLAWLPTFLIRVHHMTIHETGVLLGGVSAAGLLFGNLSGGFLADVLSRRNPKWRIWVAGIALSIVVPLGIGAAFASDKVTVMAAIGAFMYFQAFYPPCMQATAVTIADSRSRALAVATMLLFQSIGGALGPSFIGALNDLFAASYHEMAVRYSFSLSFLGSAVAAGGCLICGLRLSRPTQTQILAVTPAS